MSAVNGLDDLRTFGWSLSSGVDVDNNEYNGKLHVHLYVLLGPREVHLP